MNQQSIPLTSFQDFVCDAPANIKMTPLVEMMSKVDRDNLPKCNGREFFIVNRVKTYQGILSGGQKIIANIQVYRCAACGAIHDLNAKQ